MAASTSYADDLYDTLNLAEEALQDIAKDSGYAVSCNKVYNNKMGEVRRRTYRCAKGRKYTKESRDERNSSTRMYNCEFAADISRLKTSGSAWRWQILFKNKVYNHPLDLKASA